MGVAPGGLIKQCILEDEYSAASWDSAHTITFNVQILNSEVFRQVAGMDPPETPVDAKTYSGLGLPFYKIYNEQSSVKGNFGDIQSVKQTENSKGSNASKGNRPSDDEPPYKNPTVILNPKGQVMGFRPVSELENELTVMNCVLF